jgi:hypothetical protein
VAARREAAASSQRALAWAHFAERCNAAIQKLLPPFSEINEVTQAIVTVMQRDNADMAVLGPAYAAAIRVVNQYLELYPSAVAVGASFDSRRLMPPSLATQPDAVALNAFDFLRAAPMPLWTSMMPKRLRNAEFRESAHRATFARMLLDGVAGVGNAASPAVRAAARAALVELLLSTRMFAGNALEIECWLIALHDAPTAAIDAVELLLGNAYRHEELVVSVQATPGARDARRQARTR